jgi:hypothetical protein
VAVLFEEFMCPCWIRPRYAAVYSLGILERLVAIGFRGYSIARARVSSMGRLAGGPVMWVWCIFVVVRLHSVLVHGI